MYDRAQSGGNPQPPAPSFQMGFAGPAGPPGSGQRRRMSRRKRRELTIGLVTIGVLIAMLVTALVVRNSATPPIPLTPAQQAVRIAKDYYTAIAEGRASDALRLLSINQSDNTSLLSDEVLANSLTRAPLTEIVVGTPEEVFSDYFEVPVSYLLAGTTVTDSLTISTDNDQPILTMPSHIGFDENLTYHVNGVPLTGKQPLVFPGSYDLVVDSPYLALAGGPLLITDSTDYGGTYELTLVVSEEGVQLFREKVIAATQACLASTALDPGCGARLPGTLDDGTVVRDGSVQRGQDAESRAKLQSVTAQPGASVPTVISVHASDLGYIDITAECQDASGGWVLRELNGYGPGFVFGKPSINLADPDLAVVWD